ncbi:MAG: UDP-N-acetylmuramate dehydrogenase [Acidimicrobiia bacterium]
MTASNAIDAAVGVLGERARLGVEIGALTTYRVGGRAAVFVVAESAEDLRLVTTARTVSGLDVLVLGRGSNMLVADRGFSGIVVTLGAGFERIDVTATRVVAGGGVRLPVLARATAAAGLTGLEWAVGVPGSVGGGVRMNAGGHGSDIAATLVGVRVVDLRTGEDEEMPASALGLEFRRSALHDDDVVVAATFDLASGDRVRSEQEIADIVRWRREHQPGGQNAGSVFVNPLPESAGAIIDRLGLRGTRIGTARVSEKHANFIQADEGGSADDVRSVMELVRSKVLDATGIRLRSEVRLVGFDEAAS